MIISGVADCVPVPVFDAERTVMTSRVAVCVPAPDPVAVRETVTAIWLYVVVDDEYRMSD